VTDWQYDKIDLASAALKSCDSDIASIDELGWELVAITSNLQA
jgi:hypothetical protein